MSALLAGLKTLPPLPADSGNLRMIVRRPAVNLREQLTKTRLTVDEGLPGDAWGRNPKRLPDAQLAVMQWDVAELIANGQSLTLFGDNLFVDFDISVANLPIGSRLRVGTAVVEVTPMPHDGCSKFKARFGMDAFRFVWEASTRDQNLRGTYWKVVEPGDIHEGAGINILSRA